MQHPEMPTKLSRQYRLALFKATPGVGVCKKHFGSFTKAQQYGDDVKTLFERACAMKMSVAYMSFHWHFLPKDLAKMVPNDKRNCTFL